MVNSNLDKRINPSGQLFSNDTSCPFPISTASCTFTISSEIRPATLTKSAGWLHGSRGAMQVRRFSILSLSFASEVMRDGFSVSWLVTSLSPLWSGMFAISWTILLQVSVLYAHRFMVSGFRVTLWFRLVHFRNAWRLSLFRCQTPRKTKPWTWQPRSTTTNHSAVIHLTFFFNVFLYYCLKSRPIRFSLHKTFCSSINVSLAYKLCKATTVTHTKRIYRNLLRKETSFVYYTSSVLRKSRHMKQKEKITHCC